MAQIDARIANLVEGHMTDEVGICLLDAAIDNKDLVLIAPHGTAGFTQGTVVGHQLRVLYVHVAGRFALPDYFAGRCVLSGILIADELGALLLVELHFPDPRAHLLASQPGDLVFCFHHLDRSCPKLEGVFQYRKWYILLGLYCFCPFISFSLHTSFPP